MTAGRLAVGLGGLAVILPLIAWGGVLAVDALVLPFLLLSLDEYARMAFPREFARQRLVLAVPVLGAAFATLYTPALTSLGLFCALFWVLFATLARARIHGALDHCGRLLLGLCWVGGCFLALPLLRRQDGGVGVVVLAMALSWGADTGAYFAGRAFGRRKLLPEVSPNKTWEGALGGVVAAVAFSLGVDWVTSLPLGAVELVVLAVLVTPIGIAGDLFESLIKRDCGVKDAGSSLGPHGGILDRVDALLFVAPVLLLYLAHLRPWLLQAVAPTQG